MAARKSTDIVQVKLRLPERLRREILLMAKKSGRSLNGELVRLIEAGMAKPRHKSLIKSAAEAAPASVTAVNKVLMAKEEPK